jgi:hypothetical protein
MEKFQPCEKTKSLLGLKRKTELSFETGRACRPDITGKNRSPASATTRQKIVEATTNVELNNNSRPLDISVLSSCAFDPRRRADQYPTMGRPASAGSQTMFSPPLPLLGVVLPSVAGAIYYGKSNT